MDPQGYRLFSGKVPSNFNSANLQITWQKLAQLTLNDVNEEGIGSIGLKIVNLALDGPHSDAFIVIEDITFTSSLNGINIRHACEVKFFSRPNLAADKIESALTQSAKEEFTQWLAWTRKLSGISESEEPCASLAESKSVLAPKCPLSTKFLTDLRPGDAPQKQSNMVVTTPFPPLQQVIREPKFNQTVGADAGSGKWLVPSHRMIDQERWAKCVFKDGSDLDALLCCIHYLTQAEKKPRIEKIKTKLVPEIYLELVPEGTIQRVTHVREIYEGLMRSDTAFLILEPKKAAKVAVGF